jgi:hypothetical protein
MRSTLRVLLLTVALVAGLMPAGAQTAEPSIEEDGESSDTMRHVTNLQYERTGGTATSYGTDVEFATLTIGGPSAKGAERSKGKSQGGEERDFAFAGTYQNGLQIIDITDPEHPSVTGVYDCHVAQGDVQVFTRDDHPGKTFVGYTADFIPSRTSTDSDCYREAFGDDLPEGQDRYGTFIVDVTDPANPTTVSFAAVPLGSHNNTIHPSGKWLYNSNSELITNAPFAGIEVFSLEDIENPEHVTTLRLPPVPGLGTDSHDITFNAEGTRAYSAALSQTVIIDTEDPGNPSIVSTTVDPAINVEHQANPVTITDPILGERDFLIIEDEFVGAIPTGQCPNGGVHVYDITGSLELRPVKVGYWNIDEIRPATNDKTGGVIGEPSELSRCTAHVFEIHEDEAIMNIAFYNGGVRVVDISGLVGVALSGNGIGMKEIGFFQFPDSDTWASKTNRIAEDGSFYLFGNDVARGFDVYEFDPTGGFTDGEVRASSDVWMTPAEIATFADLNRPAEGYTPYCLLQ